MDGSWIALYPRPPAKYTVLSLVFLHDNRRPVDFCGEYSWFRGFRGCLDRLLGLMFVVVFCRDIADLTEPLH